MKKNIGLKEKELISILQKNHKNKGNTTKSEALKALENGSRTAEDQFFLWILGEDLKNIRLKKKISQRQLAKQLNTSPTNLRRIEKGERSVSAVNLYRIIRELHSNYNIVKVNENMAHRKLNEWIESDYNETEKKSKMNLEYLKTAENLDMDFD